MGWVHSVSILILVYQFPLILTALLHVDLINVTFLTHVPLSGHHDVALFE